MQSIKILVFLNIFAIHAQSSDTITINNNDPNIICVDHGNYEWYCPGQEYPSENKKYYPHKFIISQKKNGDFDISPKIYFNALGETGLNFEYNIICFRA